jgi:hypothetical protein
MSNAFQRVNQMLAMTNERREKTIIEEVKIDKNKQILDDVISLFKEKYNLEAMYDSAPGNIRLITILNETAHVFLITLQDDTLILKRFVGNDAVEVATSDTRNLEKFVDKSVALIQILTTSTNRFKLLWLAFKWKIESWF